MLGNAYEWCDDSVHENYLNAPGDGSAWIDSPEPIEHVARGGAAYVVASRCTSGSRFFQRANCGGDPQPDSDDEATDGTDNSFKDLFGIGPVYYGLRLVCVPIAEDLE